MSCTLRDMNFWSSRPFSDFYFIFNLIFTNFSYLKLQKKWFLTCRRWRGERESWRADTWRVGPPSGCDVALRPRGRATGGPRVAKWRTGGAATWQVATRPIAPRGRPCGAPRVLDIEETWGQLIGEATPLFKRVLSLHLICVGLCSHTILFFLQVTWRLGGRLIGSERRRSRGPESTRSSIKHVAICILSDPLDGWHVAERGSLDRDRMASNFRDRANDRDHPIVIEQSQSFAIFGASDLHHANAWSSSRVDHDQTAGGELESWSRRTGSANRDRSSKREFIGRWMKPYEEPRSRGDRGLFIARSGTTASQRENAPTTPSTHAHDPINGSKIGRDDQRQTLRNRRDRGWFSRKIEATTPQIDGPRSPRDRGHRFRSTTASNGRKFRA